MTTQKPGSIVNSLRVQWAMMAVAAVITILTWWMRDDVLLAWAKGNPAAEATLANGGIEALRESPNAPGFVALAVVAFIGFAMLAVVQAAFLAGGHGWARWMMTVTAFTGVVVAATCLANDLPTVFVVLSAILLVLGVVQLFFLWRKDTTRYLREV